MYPATCETFGDCDQGYELKDYPDETLCGEDGRGGIPICSDVCCEPKGAPWGVV